MPPKLPLLRFALLLAFALSACHSTSPRKPRPTGETQLSYQVDDAWVGPSFQVHFLDNGIVVFRGTRNCAVPGEQRVLISTTEFAKLKEAFEQADFFSIPRLESGRQQCIDCNVVTVTYRDEQKIHEVVDNARRLPRLTRLEDQLRNAARVVDGLINPTIEVYQRLLAEGWYVNFPDAAGENALTTALGRNPSAALFLLERGAQATRSALRQSASGSAEMFWRVAKSRGLDLKSDEAKEILVLAAGRSTPVMRSLLASGSDPNVVSFERSPIEAAVAAGSHERVKALLDAGANPRKSQRVMFAAVDQNDSGMITVLAQHGANVDARDPTGRTPLIAVSDGCKYWHVAPLLEAGADPTLTDYKGRSVMQPQTAYAEPIPPCKQTLELLSEALKKRKEGGEIERRGQRLKNQKEVGI
jgi:ankyrin repeat protein